MAGSGAVLNTAFNLWAGREAVPVYVRRAFRAGQLTGESMLS